jgi:hypothetical protein
VTAQEANRRRGDLPSGKPCSRALRGQLRASPQVKRTSRRVPWAQAVARTRPGSRLGVRPRRPQRGAASRPKRRRCRATGAAQVSTEVGRLPCCFVARNETAPLDPLRRPRRCSIWALTRAVHMYPMCAALLSYTDEGQDWAPRCPPIAAGALSFPAGAGGLFTRCSLAAHALGAVPPARNAIWLVPVLAPKCAWQRACCWWIAVARLSQHG